MILMKLTAAYALRYEISSAVIRFKETVDLFQKDQIIQIKNIHTFNHGQSLVNKLPTYGFFFARFWGYFPLGMQSSECNSQVHCTLPPMPISIQSRCETT